MRNGSKFVQFVAIKVGPRVLALCYLLNVQNAELIKSQNAEKGTAELTQPRRRQSQEKGDAHE
jgi:hypothetical protein